MKVFDVLGCEVAMLVNEFKHPGKYVVQWDASGLPSDIYFYQLQAGNVVQTKKLVLLRYSEKYLFLFRFNTPQPRLP
jgi:hypothetical protein